mmetsp:Transcript_46086/g.128113  ORF Transcript_46086/g.128113 Transcript_46086/m.128113 type:complete len:235 (+) Transcript_46086:221-925(+)
MVTSMNKDEWSTWARWYRCSLTNVGAFPTAARRSFASKTRAAHIGATALVPPTPVFTPPSRPISQSPPAASPATSGTTRCAGKPALADTMSLALSCCHGGRAYILLTPPPVAPPPIALLFHTSSVRSFSSWVPPHARTDGWLDGQSVCAAPSSAGIAEPMSSRSSLEPPSPEAAHTVIPKALACSSTSSISFAPHAATPSDSGMPQEMEMTLLRSSTARRTAAMKPARPMLAAR